MINLIKSTFLNSKLIKLYKWSADVEVPEAIFLNFIYKTNPWGNPLSTYAPREKKTFRFKTFYIQNSVRNEGGVKFLFVKLLLQLSAPFKLQNSGLYFMDKYFILKVSGFFLMRNSLDLVNELYRNICILTGRTIKKIKRSEQNYFYLFDSKDIFINCKICHNFISKGIKKLRSRTLQNINLKTMIFFYLVIM